MSNNIEKLKNNCDLFVDNWNSLKKIFKRENEKLTLVGSTILSNNKIEANARILKACEEFIADNTKKSSEFQSMIRIPLICKMSIQDKPGVYFERVKWISELLSTYKWLSAEYKVTAAMIIADCTGSNSDDETIRYYLNEADKIMISLKDHFGKTMLESEYPYIAMLASTDYEIEPLLDDVYSSYRLDSGTFKDQSACRILSYILAISDDVISSDKRSKTIAIFKELEKNKFKYGGGYEIAIMGALSFLGMPAKEIGEYFLMAEEYLRLDKHCRGYTMKPDIRAMYSALMVWHAFKDDYEQSADSYFTDIVSLAIQIEVAVIKASSSSIFRFSSKM